jgi:hypothetical protein
MPRTLAPAKPETLCDIDVARNALRIALDCAREAGTPKLAAKIQSALKSADGAQRHARRRIDATARSA